jgi:hypothetical protein
METCYGKSHIEILPAALLSQRPAWKEIGQSLPAGACLLVTDAHHPQQIELMQMLAQSFREKGRRVVLWSLGRKSSS